MRICLTTVLMMTALPLFAQEEGTFKNFPKQHETNKAAVTKAYKANLKKYKNDSNILVLRGLVADKKKQRVEVMVESTGLASESSCEFLVIGETSSHGYEALLIAFAKPSDLHQALKFIGKEPGAPYDPSSLRFWAKGDPFTCTLVTDNKEQVLLEQMIVDKDTGKTLPEKGFLFTGSQTVESMNDPVKKVYAADEYDPKALVSLFNTTAAVLQVPYWAPQGEVYEKSTVNPEHELPEGALLTLIFEPSDKNTSTNIKNLKLEVQAGSSATNDPLTDIARLNALQFQLKDGDTVLNRKPDLKSTLTVIDSLDRQKYQYFLTLYFGANITLGDAHVLAMIISVMDSEKGLRIEPPPAGQLFYKSFLPDKSFMNREERIVHPWELSLVEKDGNVSGTLVLVNPVWKDDNWKPELEITELPVAIPKDLRRELDAEAERTAKAEKMAKPAVILVFASPAMKYGKLMKFLELALPTHKIIHVFVNDPMPPIPKKKS